MLKIAIIGGARPNFMKIAPLCWALKKQKIPHILIDTGQHFSQEMAANFFIEFDLKPSYHLRPPRTSVLRQITGIITGLERILVKEMPALVVVVGDVNSTLAGALAANKLKIKLAHIEAGLRSFNRQMPEEFNRKLTDHLSDYLFVTTEEGIDNLASEGIHKNVYFVGNLMIDTLNHFLPKIKNTDEKFFFCTLHRPENIDAKIIFSGILDALEIISADRKIYFSLHPRTKKMAKKFNLSEKMKKIFTILPPLDYTDSIYYQKNAQLVLTDSGGIQEETSFLGVPCLTLRAETERPVTVRRGTNVIGGVTKKSILAAYQKIDFRKRMIRIPLWDGRAAARIVKIIKNKIFG